MSEEEYVRFSDPRQVIEDGRAETLERRHQLQEVLAGPREPETDDEAVLDRLVDQIADRVADQLTDPEPQPTRADGFDGGARRSLPPPPESHNETLVKLLRSRAADQGAYFHH